MKHIKKFNELSSLGSLIGKGAGLVSNAFSKISLDLSNKKDTDLGREILNHINNMPRVYNRSGVKDETTINKSNKPSGLTICITLKVRNRNSNKPN
jgi:hypothetical protein